MEQQEKRFDKFILEIANYLDSLLETFLLTPRHNNNELNYKIIFCHIPQSNLEFWSPMKGG